MTNHNQGGGLRRIWNAGLYSLAGIRASWKNEAAFRQESLLSLVLIPAAFWYGSTAIERVLLIGSCLIVLIVELLNSAVEATIDRIGGDRHELSGRAKDMGSAAVFISLWAVVMTWGLIGYERFIA
jgi:diacylglycerol kinase (ATP)